MAKEYVWICNVNRYRNWAPQERAAVDEFLRGCGVDPSDVQIGQSNELVVWRLDDGSLSLTLWVSEREDGKLVRCPTCPCCVKQHEIEVAVTAPLPLVSTAWIAEEVAAGTTP